MKNLVFICLLFLSFSCKNFETKSSLVQNSGEALGTTYSIQYEGNQDYHDDLKKVFDLVNQSMSTYLPSSVISKINSGDSTVIVDAHFETVFLLSKKIWMETNGVFDPTVGPLVNAYGFGPKGKLKGIDSIEVDSIKQFVGMEKVLLTKSKSIKKQDSRTFIDFNAIAKGYTIDLLGELLDSNDIQNYLIELGGELLAKGINTNSGKDWIVGIDDPTQTEERTLIKKIKLKDVAMATSGNYRKTRIDPDTGAHYVHTINPKTGWPKISNVLSVSVLAETCAEADAYATAFMAMELEESKSFLSSNENVEAYIIYVDENNVMQEWFTEGFQKLIVE
ncbi:FAD:protein FMN transferase [Planktosalinus lacus]|uniref:FAD:protein FMN transferase n=1 Tax=Planktosalinus lacus TaxID=1526573 RepID=A0A8J2V8F9_9FLAO|nr:FAD:protein FMN transferase [Planktosalinus lacus]GGD87778.1 FAD:protein FMN transferase [Planktosalinus lacus]